MPKTRAQIDAARQGASEPIQPIPQSPVVTPTAAAITEALDSITDPESVQDLALLAGALDALPLVPDGAACAPALLRVFERFRWAVASSPFGGLSTH